MYTSYVFGMIDFSYFLQFIVIYGSDKKNRNDDNKL